MSQNNIAFSVYTFSKMKHTVILTRMNFFFVKFVIFNRLNLKRAIILSDNRHHCNIFIIVLILDDKI